MKTTTQVVREVREVIEADLKTFNDRLSAQVLDGTPFLLCLNVDGVTRVYGEWEGQKGYMAAELVPAHLCGTIQMSQENAQRNAALLAARGEKSFYQHWRAFCAQRVEALNQLLAVLPVA